VARSAVRASEFGIFDVLPNEEGRTAHLNGKGAEALQQHGPDLLAADPSFEQVDIIAAKLP
jgi:hypothetical protein